MAIKFMMGLTRHDWDCFHPALVEAVWCNFDFFSEIRPHRVRRIQRVEGSGDQLGYWVVTRQVDFYFRNQLVAEVSMIGQQVDRNEHSPRFSCWAVNGVNYARRFDRKEPEEWRQVTWQPCGLTVTDLGK